MDRIARFIVDRAKPILAATAILTLVAAAALTQIQLNADVTSFIVEGNARGAEFAALQDKYATADPINVLVSSEETLVSGEGLASLIELADRYSAVEGVASVGSLVPETNPLTGLPITSDFAASLTPAMVEGFLSQSPLADLLLSEDGRHSLMVVVPEDDGLELAGRLADVEISDDIEVTLAGNPVIFASVIDQLGWFLLVIPPIVIALLLGTFYATIGDRRLTVLSVLPAAVGSVWTFGFIIGIGIEVDLLTVIVPIFVIVMGSADGLHFVTHFQEEAARTNDVYDRVASALRQVGVPMILTTVSTGAGFLSLLFTDVEPIRQLGLFVALGITFAGLISFFSLPAILSRLTVEPAHHTALIGPRVVAILKGLAPRRGLAAAISVAIVAFGLVFIPQLEVDSDQLFFFKDGHEVRAAFEAIEEVFGGATPLTGEFAWDPESGTEGMAAIVASSRSLEQLNGVRQVFSVADLAGSLPPEQLPALMSGQIQLPLGDMVSEDGLRFVLFPGQFDGADLQTWIDFAEGDENIRVLTGMPVLWDEMARLVTRAQVGSLVAAFVLVALMLGASYRRWRETFISLVPIALTVVALLGFIAFAGIQLNLVTAIASSIVIGVGIDYAIHFIAAIDHARAEGDGYVLRAIERAGRPIVANALGIALGLTALWLSPLKPHSQISMIMWVSMLTAAGTALLVIPALLPRAGTQPLQEPPADPGQPQA